MAESEDKCGQKDGVHVLDARIVIVEHKITDAKRATIAIFHGKQLMMISKSTAMDLVAQLKKCLDKII